MRWRESHPGVTLNAGRHPEAYKVVWSRTPSTNFGHLDVDCSGMNSLVEASRRHGASPMPRVVGAGNRLWSCQESLERPAGAQRAYSGRIAGGSDRPISASSMWIVTA